MSAETEQVSTQSPETVEEVTSYPGQLVCIGVMQFASYCVFFDV